MVTVTSENKAEFDREFLKKKGLLKDKKENSEGHGLVKGETYEFHHPKGSKYKYLGSMSVDAGQNTQHRFKGESPNSYRSLLEHELEKHLKR